MRCRHWAFALPTGALAVLVVGIRARSGRIRGWGARISAGCRRYFIGGAYCSRIANRVRGWRGTRRSGEPEKIPNSP